QAHRPRDPRGGRHQTGPHAHDGPHVRRRWTAMTTATVSASGSIPRARGGILRTIYIVWWRDVIRFWRDRARLVASFPQPLLLLAPFVGVTFTVTSFFELLGLMIVLAFGLSAFGVAIASRMKSMQGFQVVMNFLMMPMFFLSGALFPLVGLPLWMTVLTRLDPASYGIDPIRRTLLGAPAERLALTIGDQTVPIIGEIAVVLLFGIVMLAIGA